MPNKKASGQTIVNHIVAIGNDHAGVALKQLLLAQVLAPKATGLLWVNDGTARTVRTCSYVPKNTKIVPTYCTDSEVLELIDQYYDYEISVDGILREIETGIRDEFLETLIVQLHVRQYILAKL